ncbi:MAG: hypothetical protein A2Y12_04550 [Planctomycetes bacterium GWF2_42_9]|nr:MAG: hypothetical protein A2Y12_04550 [Planctomycetes bacterium GWF2_42_9]HAL45217.1 hypothetical protein [Phycisphaerales bacterium]
MAFNGISIWLTTAIAIGALSALIGLHFLYRNYTKVKVPTLIFWQTVTQNTMYNRLWKKFRQLLTFIFLAIILLLLISPMTRPFLSANRTPSQYAVILDCRASMQIADEGFSQNRFERAVALCKDFLKNSSDFDKTMIITVGDTVNVIKGFNDDKAAGLYALKHINVSQSLTSSVLPDAIEIARSSMPQNPNTHIIVYTDHALELNNMPAKTKQHLSIVNLSQPLSNAAILQSKIAAAESEQSQIILSVCYWGENNSNAVLELYENDNLLQKQDISLTPNTIEQYNFAIKNSSGNNLSAKLICDDKFQNDNSIIIPQDTARKIYLEPNAPAAIKFYIDANPSYKAVKSANDADVSISVIRNRQPVLSTSKIIPTEQLYADKNKRDSISNDLFVIGGCVLSDMSQNILPLLSTEDGKILAASEGNSILLANSLFTEQSTFWKQPQFPELMQQIIESAFINNSAEKSELTQAAYANLWNVGEFKNLQIIADSQKPIPLYKYLIISALLLLCVEGYAFYKGVIV